VLIGNYSVLQKSPTRFLAGSTTSVESNVRSNFGKSGMQRNRLYPDSQTTARAYFAVPSNYYPPYTWLIPQIAGGIGSINQIAGAGTASIANLAGGLNAAAPLSGAGTVTNAQGSLILQAVAALVGSGVLTGSLIAQANIAAALVGAGNITAATGQLASILQAVAALSGAGALSATLGALAGLLATVSGTGSVSSALPSAPAGMSADLVVTGGTLSTANVGAAVWSAIAAANNTAGTMGQKVNSAASAGDPWGTAVPGSYVAGTAGYILGNLIAGLTAEQAAQLLSLAQVHGLVVGSPLVVTATSRTAGGVSQTIDDAAGTVTVTRT